MIVLAVALLAAAVAVGAWYAVRLHRRRQQLRVLQAGLDELRSGIDDTTLQLSELVATVRRDLELVRGTFATEEHDDALGDAPEILATAEELLGQRTDMPQPAYRTGAARTEPSTLQRWKDYGQQVREIHQRLQAEEQRLTEELATVERVSSQLGHARELVDEVRRAITEGEAAGYEVGTEAGALSVAVERLTEADRRAAEHRLRAADTVVAELSQDLTETRDNLLSLRRRSAELETQTTTLAAGIKDLTRQEHNAREYRDLLTEHFAPGVWSGLADFVNDGGSAARQAHSELDSARSALAMGDLTKAQVALSAAEDQRASAETALQVPRTRHEVVQQLRETLPGQREAVRGRLAGIEHSATKDEAIHPLAEVIAELYRQLDAVDLTSTKPEWLLGERRIVEIDRLVTSLAELSRHSTDVVTRLRTDVERAKTALYRAREKQQQAEAELKWHLGGRKSRR